LGDLLGGKIEMIDFKEQIMPLTSRLTINGLIISGFYFCLWLIWWLTVS
jgi:hypothetical protein